MTREEFKAATVGMLVDVLFVPRMIPALSPDALKRGPIPDHADGANYVAKRRRILATNGGHRRAGDPPTIRVLDYYLRDVIEIPADMVEIPGDEP